MNTYWKIQIRSFIESFKVFSSLKILLLQAAKLILTMILMAFSSGAFLYIFMRMGPLLDTIDAINGTRVTMDLAGQFAQNKYLFTQFFIGTIILIIVSMLLFIMINSVFDSIIIRSIKKERWTRQSLFKFIRIYAAVTALFTILLFVLSYYATDAIAFYLLFFLCITLFLYMTIIYQLSIKDNTGFITNLWHGLKKFIRFDYTIFPIIAIIITSLIALILLILLAILLKQFVIIPAVLLLITISIWIINYFTRLYANAKLA